jgi:hypothetical protein
MNGLVSKEYLDENAFAGDRRGDYLCTATRLDPTNTNVLREGKGATLWAELQLYEALACSRNHMDR